MRGSKIVLEIAIGYPLLIRQLSVLTAKLYIHTEGHSLRINLFEKRILYFSSIFLCKNTKTIGMMGNMEN